MGLPLTLSAPAMVRRVNLAGFWPQSLAQAPLATAFKMLEVVKPDNVEEGRVRPLSPPIDMVGIDILRGEALPKGKVSAVELAEKPQLDKGSKLT